MLLLCETGCNSHVLYVDITTCYFFCHALNGFKLGTKVCDVAISHDSHIHILNDIASIDVALVPMYRERLLA